MSEWPSALTAMPALKSRYRRPSVSQIYAPFPCDMTTGGRAYTGRTYCAERSMRALTVRGTLAVSSGWVTAVNLVDGALGSDAAERGAFWVDNGQIHTVTQSNIGRTSGRDDARRTAPTRSFSVVWALNRVEQPTRLRVTAERFMAAFGRIYVGRRWRKGAVSPALRRDLRGLSVRSHGGGKETLTYT